MKYECKKDEKLIKSLIHNVQGMSFGSAQKTIRLGKIKVNNTRTKDNINVKVGDIIDVYEFVASKPTVDILYEDDNIIIVNKPYGIECATRDKSSDNTYSLEELLSEHHATIVHRLDRLTEGIVILAKTHKTTVAFEKIFRTRQIEKKYQALVYGQAEFSGIKKAYLKKDSKSALVDISDQEKPNYKEIITEFKILEGSAEYSILDITLHTGRTHQIRAHLSHLGHSVVGDSKYLIDNKNNNLNILKQLQEAKYNGYCLTAYKINFNIEDKELAYLNNLHIEIEPSWRKLIKIS